MNLVKSVISVGSLTFVSRMLGFVRDMLFARFFGASAEADAFWVAFKIPNFFRRLFAEGAFSQAFIPVYAEIQQAQSPAEQRQFLAAVTFRLTLVVTSVVVVLILFAPAVIYLFAPGFANDAFKFAIATQLLQMTAPYLLLITWVALSAAILNANRHFFAPAITPVWLNISLIAAMLFGQQWVEEPILVMGWGVIMAGLMQWLFNLPFLARYGLLVMPQPAKHPQISKIQRLMLPALLGVSVAQINLLVDTLLASFLVTGSVSWLSFSDRLMEFPVGIFGVALATIILPVLSQQIAQGDLSSAKQTLRKGLNFVLIIGVPATIGLIVLSGPLLSTLFQYGAFGVVDVKQSALSLQAYALGLMGFILVKIFAPAFYARQNMRTPVRIAVIAMLANLLFSLVLIQPLAHQGLALATSISAWVNAGLLGFILIKQKFLILDQQVLRTFLTTTVAAVLMTFVLLWISPPLSFWLHGDAWWRLQWLSITIILAVGVYFVVLKLAGFRLSWIK